MFGFCRFPFHRLDAELLLGALPASAEVAEGGAGSQPELTKCVSFFN